MLWPNGSKTRPRITSPFGPRKAPVAGASTFHRGTDFVGFSTVRAIAAGRVERVGTPSGWGGGGLQVWLRHGDGSLSRYMHLRSYSVHVGQSVAEGGTLGVMGATGNVSGVHLHLEIVPAGAAAQVDAVGYIQARLSTAARGGYADGSAELRSFQEKLIRMGHDLGKTGADAVLGAKTRAATKHEQGMAAKNGYPGGALTQDGIPGPSTNGYLDWWLVGRHQAPAPAPAAPARVVRLGSRGDLVRALQHKLKTAYSLYAGRLAVDGIAGPATIAAVREFQRRAGLAVDGIAGPATLAKLGI